MHTNNKVCMKHSIKSFLIAAMWFTTVFRPQLCRAEDDVAGAANRFVDLLVKKDFAGAESQCDATMKSAIPEAKMGELWQTLQAQAGTFGKRVQTRTSKAGNYDIALVTCAFANANIEVKVVLNQERKVAGLFFLPTKSAAETSAVPPYARTNAFVETDCTVGGGKWALSGTLAMPKNENASCAAVVLVHGSGPNDRDETIGGAKVFRDLAWGLASKGIAVLRYDKRTKVHGAEIVQDGVEKLTVREEVIDDALAAVKQLRTVKHIDPKRIFIAGHSLGATLAPRIAEGDSDIAGIIIMAGATRPIEDIVIEQTRYLAALDPAASDAAREKLRTLESQAQRIRNLTEADANSSEILIGGSPKYWLDLRAHPPLEAAKTLTMPMLILQGGRDYQVTKINYDDWTAAFAVSPRATLKWYPDLNHLFISGEGQSTPQEYDKPGFVSETVVADMARWISTR
jgi:uncharacterized protein